MLLYFNLTTFALFIDISYRHHRTTLENIFKDQMSLEMCVGFFYIEDKQYELNVLYVYIAKFDFSGVCSLCLVYKGCELIVLIIKLFKTSSKYVLIYDRGRLEIESINKRCKYKQSGDSKHLDSALLIIYCL